MVLSLSVKRYLLRKTNQGSSEEFVGAGDSMVAGFTGKLATTGDVIEAFKWGVACGTATTFSDDLATADYIKETMKSRGRKTMKIQDVLNKKRDVVWPSGNR